jgi:hypothetical protein
MRHQEWGEAGHSWALPVVHPEGVITVVPIEETESEAASLRSELNDVVAQANGIEDGQWERRQRQAEKLTQMYQSGR